jgi:rhodanese-related sulfurtransferase
MPIKSVDATTLKCWIDKGEAILVDVREPFEHSAQNIHGATLLPLVDVNKGILPDTGKKKLVIHCRSGNRSKNACEKLLVEDSSLEIYNLEGGILEWEETGYPVVSSGKFFLPLDRQVQLTIGLSVLIGSVLTYFVTPLFALLTGFLGAGLSLAGLTGFCGLAVIMAKMPWNKLSDRNTTNCSVK